MRNKFKVGDIATIATHKDDHSFPKGTKVKIIGICDTEDYDYKAEYLDGSDWWWIRESDLTLNPSGTAIIRRTRNGGYRSTLVGKNGEVMFTSEVYTTKAMCKKTLKLFPDFQVVDKTKPEGLK